MLSGLTTGLTSALGSTLTTFGAFRIENVLQVTATISGGVIALVFLVFIVKDAIGLIKGDGSASLGKIIIKVLSIILLIGLVFMMTNYTSLGQKSKEVGESVVDTAKSVTDQAR